MEALIPLYDVQQGLHVDTPVPQGARAPGRGLKALIVEGF